MISAFIILATASLFCRSTMVYAATRLMQENFESGTNWSYSAQSLSQYPDLGNNWNIVKAGPRSGSYCAESKPPGDPTFLGDSCFAYSLPTNASGVFMRFWFKAKQGLNPYKFEYMRLTAVSGSNEIEIGLGYPTGSRITAHVYAPGINGTYDTGWGNPTTTTSWTEYAFYIDYSKNTMTFWKNAKSYTASDPSAVTINIGSGGPYNRVLTPVYYKGWMSEGGSVSTYWVDDIEIWKDGVPGAGPDSADSSFPPPPPTGLTYTILP
jgi:hypothetical protein